VAVFKWVLVFFAVLSLSLFAISKIISFLNPPRPGRPEPPILRSVTRALRWSVILPALLGLAVLTITLLRG
jgi:hypothetical protein